MFAETITSETPIQIGLVVTVIGSFVGGALWIQKALTRFQHSLDLFKLEVHNRLTALEDRTGGRMTRAEMRAWIHEFRALNPGIKIPDIDADGRTKE